MKKFIILFTALSVSAIGHAGVLYDSESQTALVSVKTNEGLKFSLCSGVSASVLNRSADDLIKSASCQNLTRPPLTLTLVTQNMTAAIRAKVHAVFERARTEQNDNKDAMDHLEQWKTGEALKLLKPAEDFQKLDALASQSSLSNVSSDQLTESLNLVLSAAK